MPRAVVGAGPYKGVWYLPDKLQFLYQQTGEGKALPVFVFFCL